MLTVAYQNPWSGADGLGITALLLASYACGVLLRLFGTLSRVLIISAAHMGLLGDPWELAGSHGAISLRDRAWRTRHPAAQVELYKKYLDGDDERNSRLRQIAGRESSFVHIAGILGFALLVLIPFFLYASTSWQAVPLLSKLPCVPTIIGLVVAAVVLIIGHYEHAQVIRLLLRASELARKRPAK